MMAVVARTAEQYLAAGPDGSAWVSANAGTGKTHVLVDRVLRILLEGVRPERILCLTFTKAAAGEMASRVHKALGEWVTLDDDALTEVITAATGASPDDKRLSFARTLFARALETPGGLKIQTIHAFAEALLRRFPLEAHVSPHFEVLDEGVVQAHLTEARNQVLKWGADASDPDLNQAIEFLVERLAEDRFDGLISALVAARGDLGDLFHRYDYEDVVARIYEMVGLDPNANESSILARHADSESFDEAALRQVAEVLSAGSKNEQKMGAALLSWLEAPDRANATRDILGHLLTRAKGVWRKKEGGRVYTKKLLEASPEIANILDTECERAIRTQTDLLKAGVILSTSAALLVGHHILDAFSKLKAADGGLDYNDLILKAGDLLQAADVAPWVLYKLDGGIDHILVDEAQDTSPEQWNIIWSIAVEFFSGQGAHEDSSIIERTVFAVGDEKQSIYRFQGADPAMFSEMNQRFAERAENVARSFERVQLDRSFRSTPEVLAIVDAVFSEAPAHEGVTAPTTPLHHLAHRRDDKGLVELWPAIRPDDTEADSEPWHAPVDYVGKSDPKVELARRITDQIETWLKTGEQLSGKNRPINPGDILILVQRRNDFFVAMIRELKLRGIPVAGRDRMRLSEQLVVMDLMAIGRFALLPQDDLTLAVVLRSPFFNISEDDLFDLAWDRSGSLWQSLVLAAKTDARFAQAAEELSALLSRVDFDRPFEFYAHILNHMSGRKKLAGRLGPDAIDPMDEFLNRTIEYEGTAPATLQGFLDWLEKSDVEIKRDLEQDRGEVRVMTVHGAKGLEAPIVFLPDTCAVGGARNHVRLLPAPLPGDAPNKVNVSGLREARLPLWVPKRADEDGLSYDIREALSAADIEEYHRLLYVAMTRAEDRLYICGFETKNGRDKGCWHDLVALAMEKLGTEFTLPQGDKAWRFGDPGDLGEKWADGAADDDQALVLPDWALADAPPPEPAKRPLRPSHLTGEDPPVQSPLNELDEGRFERGRLIHALLQRLPELPPSAWEEVALAFLKRRKPDLAADELESLVAEILGVLNHTEFKAVFGEGSMAEVPLSGSLNGSPFYGQVDRLVVTDSEVMVVDFKTNRPPPKLEADIHPNYIAQMATYRAALQDIYPDHVIRVALLWTDGPTLMPIGDETLNKYAG